MKFVAKKGSKYSDVASRMVNYLYDKNEHAYSEIRSRSSLLNKIMVQMIFFRYKKKALLKKRIKSDWQ